jgi:cyclomaltodextrinase / maltogenic alpha-amylase / neopullulanase
MTGGHDPANRGAFPWHQKETWDTELLHDFQRFIALRHQRPALRRGSFQFLWAKDGVIAFARQLADETIVVLFNASRDTRALDLPLGAAPLRQESGLRRVPPLVADGTILAECWTHDAVKVEQGMIGGLKLAPRSARAFATP